MPHQTLPPDVALGNTPAICRKSSVFPAIVDAYLDGSLLELLAQAASPATDEPSGLSREEREVLAVMRRLEQVREEKGRCGAAFDAHGPQRGGAPGRRHQTGQE